MKRTLLAVGAVMAAFALVLGAWAWAARGSGERERELAWLEALATWIDRIERRMEGGDFYPAANCDVAYAVRVGEPPARLGEAGRLARLACRSLRRWVETEHEDPPRDWSHLRAEVIADLIEQRRGPAAAPAPALASRAAPLAGPDEPRVYCWTLADWEELNEEWERVESDEFRLAGFAEPEAATIDLAPHVCEPLHRFFGGDYAPSQNEASLDLAKALVVLAHEAEHLRTPEADEAAVECVALQRVRDLVREARRGAPYQELMAGLAWDVGYPDVLPEYRTASCRDGGPLDVRPESTVWP